MAETLKVEILGRPITLKSSISRERLEFIVRLLNEKINEARKVLASVTNEEVAIMAALNLAYEYLEIKEDWQKLQQEVERKSKQLINLIDTHSSLPLR